MAVAKKSKASSKGLGKGLGNLIRESEEDENVVVKEVVKEVVVKEPGEMKVRLSQIEPNREQPRKVFDTAIDNPTDKYSSKHTTQRKHNFRCQEIQCIK